VKSKSTLIERGVLVVESSGDDAAIIGEANALKAMADRMTAVVLFTSMESVW
jgi:regulator of RNase E activity RraA